MPSSCVELALASLKPTADILTVTSGPLTVSPLAGDVILADADGGAGAGAGAGAAIFVVSAVFVSLDVHASATDVSRTSERASGRFIGSSEVSGPMIGPGRMGEK